MTVFQGMYYRHSTTVSLSVTYKIITSHYNGFLSLATTVAPHNSHHLQQHEDEKE
jgi:hypothetical protein